MATLFLAEAKEVQYYSVAQKLMLTLVWYYEGVILENYMPRETSITSNTYCDLLKNHLEPGIR